jgi:hypothetical protein
MQLPAVGVREVIYVHADVIGYGARYTHDD